MKTLVHHLVVVARYVIMSCVYVPQLRYVGVHNEVCIKIYDLVEFYYARDKKPEQCPYRELFCRAFHIIRDLREILRNIMKLQPLRILLLCPNEFLLVVLCERVIMKNVDGYGAVCVLEDRSHYDPGVL